MLVGSGRAWQGLRGSGRVGGAAARGLPPRLAPNGPRLVHSDTALGAQKLELGLSDAAGKDWKVLVRVWVGFNRVL